MKPAPGSVTDPPDADPSGPPGVHSTGTIGPGRIGARIAAVTPPRLARARAWERFTQHRAGYLALRVLTGLLALGTLSPLICNERPLIARHDGVVYFPILHNPPESAVGGAFGTATDWQDPFVRDEFAKPGNWTVFTLDRFSPNTVDLDALAPNPAPPSAANWLGTDALGRDLVARLLAGFAVSMGFALVLTFLSTTLGLAAGAMQGYFGGWIDLVGQRLIDVWSAMPALYVLIITAALFVPSLALLVLLFALFGWMGLADYVRAEFLRNRNLEFVVAARAMGFSSWYIMRRHILPNSLAPVLTFVPFRIGEAILGLSALDFLGLGVPGSMPSLGELLREGRENLDAWWISGTSFAVLTTTLLLLTCVGEGLREAFAVRRPGKR